MATPWGKIFGYIIEYMCIYIYFMGVVTLRDIDATLKLSNVECLEWEWKVCLVDVSFIRPELWRGSWHLAYL